VDSVSPTANVLRALELIQTRPGVTAAEIAERLDVSERAVRRYVSILREAGVAVDAIRGRHGGYRLGRSLRPPPLVFTAGEALGLVMAVLDGHHAASDLNDPVGSALGKILNSLPAPTARQAAKVRANALAARDRGAARPDPVITTALAEALSDRRGIRIGYTTARGTTSELRVDPWALVVRHGRWYLLCHSHAADETRAYRVDRISTITVLNADVEPPADLDPLEALEAHLSSGWPYETHVTFDAPLSEVTRWVRHPMGRWQELDGGARCSVRGTTENVDMYAGEWLAPIPITFHVIGCAQLRDAADKVGRRMLAASLAEHRKDSSPAPS